MSVTLFKVVTALHNDNFVIRDILKLGYTLKITGVVNFPSLKNKYANGGITEFDYVDTVLSAWVQKFKGAATIGALRTAFKSMGLNTTAGKLTWKDHMVICIDDEVVTEDSSQTKHDEPDSKLKVKDTPKVKLTDEQMVNEKPYLRDGVGYAFIVNILDVYGEQYRRGALQDSMNLLTMFAEIGYQPTIHQDVATRADLAKHLHGFKEFLKTKENIGSVIIIVCSHGEEDDQVKMSSGELVPIWEDIVGSFGTTDAPDLKNIPKIFFVQSCRGNEHLQKDSRKVNIQNAMVCFSTLNGYVSYRDVDLGSWPSWYLQCLTKVIKEHANDLDLIKILDEVQKELEQLPKVQERYKGNPQQLCEHKPFQFANEFYFNPPS